jgi:hypothetical protein
MSIDDPNDLENSRLDELFHTVSLLLKSDLVQVMDPDTRSTLIMMRDLVKS